jgi:flagella basal body P-ring formation protein FlgA
VIAAALLMAVAALRADGIRKRVADIYAPLQTPSMRISPDTTRLADTAVGPEGASSWEVFRDGGPRPVGTEVLILAWKRPDGSSLRREWLQVRVRRVERLAIARRRLERGEIPDSSCLKWDWRETFGSEPPPPDSSGLRGLRLRTGAGPGQILTTRQLEPVPTVVRGQRITMVSSREGASATVQGIAQEDGSSGSSILVLSPFGRRIRCRVQDDGTARSLE